MLLRLGLAVLLAAASVIEFVAIRDPSNHAY